MKIKAILFDLDGTLLPMNLHAFQQTSSQLFAKKMEKYGYDPEQMNRASWEATFAMAANDGSKTNDKVYFDKMSEIYGESIKKDFCHFIEFYEKEFDAVKAVCGYNPEAAETLSILKEKRYRLILATNAWFPACAIESRIRWAGIDPEIFDFYSTFDTHSYSKPSLGYYQEILEREKLLPEECLMVGNDVREDMCAENLGIKVFLMTDDLINKEGKDISRYPKGGFKELLNYIEMLQNQR